MRMSTMSNVNKMMFNIIYIWFHRLDQIQSDITVLPLEKHFLSKRLTLRECGS